MSKGAASHYPQKMGGKWVLTAGDNQVLIDGAAYYYINIDNVSRDGTTKISRVIILPMTIRQRKDFSFCLKSEESDSTSDYIRDGGTGMRADRLAEEVRARQQPARLHLWKQQQHKYFRRN